MRKMLSVALLMCIVVLSSTLLTAVHATPPTTASGKWTYVSTITEERFADGNWIIYGTEESTWEGTFDGTSEEVFKAVWHNFPSGFLTYEITIYFSGKVDGVSGTLVILVVGKETVGEKIMVWGKWVVLSGTGDLANLHGQGTYSGPPDNTLYSGQIHFD